MALNRRVTPDRRKKQRRKQGYTAVPFVSSKVFAVGPGIEQGVYKQDRYVDIGRRKYGNQKVWPRELERRAYIATRGTLIGNKKLTPNSIKTGDKVTTTRRKIDSYLLLPQIIEPAPDRRKSERRVNKKLAKQISKAAKK